VDREFCREARAALLPWMVAHFAWSERARAHDHHIDVIREEGMEEAIKEEAARQARQIELVRGRFNELMARTFHEDSIRKLLRES
jgi:hypothetical protein